MKDFFACEESHIIEFDDSEFSLLSREAYKYSVSVKEYLLLLALSHDLQVIQKLFSFCSQYFSELNNHLTK